MPKYDDRFARQNRYGPPPEFPLASASSGIVHHLSGPNEHALARPRRRGGQDRPAMRLPRREGSRLVCFHCALGFRTAQRLARALDSLVRVSRRVGEVTDYNRRPLASRVDHRDRQATKRRELRAVPAAGYPRAPGPRLRKADAESLLDRPAETGRAPITLARGRATLRTTKISQTVGRDPRRTLVQRRDAVHAKPPPKVATKRGRPRTA